MKSHTYRGLASYARKLTAVTLLAMLTLYAQHAPSVFARCADPDGCLLPGEEEDPLPHCSKGHFREPIHSLFVISCDKAKD